MSDETPPATPRSDPAATADPAGVTVRTFRGADVLPFIQEAARLRIDVFREFPYLYDGNRDYEERYMRTYAQSAGSVFVVATDSASDRIVGVSTAIPMADEEPDFQRPFREAGIDPSIVFYFGESVLEKAWRGRGIGVRFFEERERCATDADGIRWMAFCAVDRPADHPARPPEYEPLDRFWQKRGFVRRPDLVTTYSWREVGDAEESPKRMTFWLKETSAVAG